MRLRTNHINAHTDPVGFVVLTGGVVTVFMLLLTLVWTLDGISYRRMLPMLRAEAQKLPDVKSAAAAEPTLMIDRQTVQQTAVRVHALNVLPGAGGGEMVKQLMRFEGFLPAKARLSRLQYQANNRRWSLVAEATNAETLASFASRLEAEAGFSAVQVQSQTTRDERKHGSVSRMELWVTE